MATSTIIMFFTSILFLAMGIGVFYSKTFKNLEKEKRTYAKINASIYIFVGTSSLVLAIFNYINTSASKIIMLIFAFIIFISALIQLVLAKTLQK